MDIYKEQIVKRVKTAKDYAVIAGGVLLAAVLSATALIFNRLIFNMGIILIVFMWYGVYLLVNSRNLEYEYILTNNELDIDKIIAKNGRKRVITIDFKNVDICANINNKDFKSQYENENNLSQKLVLAGDMRADNIYFADFYVEGERKRVLFQPSEIIMGELVKINPRNIYA